MLLKSNKNSGKLMYCWVILTFCMILSSCTTAPVRPVTSPQVQAPFGAMRQDVYHVVGPYETLWRISKMYDVPMADIARANNMQNIQQLEMGQKLLIPDAMPIKPIVYLYPSHKWKYIIIHHSATDEGNSLNFYFSHRSRGWDTVGYDFVIDNGSQDKEDGQIEAAPRWIKQLDGAHCKADGMNTRGIGICLVGDFNVAKPSQKQLNSLVYLVNLLRDYYNIPDANILGHGMVKGAKTDCPGKIFPWDEFRSKLRANHRQK